MHKQKLIILIIACVGLISIFFPWFSVPFIGNIIGTTVEFSWVGSIIYGVSIVFVIIGDRTEAIMHENKWVSAVLGGIVSVLGLYFYLHYKEVMSEMDNSDNMFTGAIAKAISVQFGLILYIMAGIALAVVSILKFDVQEGLTKIDPPHQTIV